MPALRGWRLHVQSLNPTALSIGDAAATVGGSGSSPPAFTASLLSRPPPAVLTSVEDPLDGDVNPAQPRYHFSDPRESGVRFVVRPPRDGAEMGFDQYHEPPEELPAQTRTFARLCASLTEEAEAIGWYEQRIAIEPDPEAVAVMRDAVGEEYKHFSMDLEFLLRRTPVWRETAQGILFQPGDIVAHGEAAEEAAGKADGQANEAADDSGSLGIGSLRSTIS